LGWVKIWIRQTKYLVRGGKALTSFEKHAVLLKPVEDWEQLKVGAGPPPIKTRAGWLVFYHAVSSEKVYGAT
jgi:predicted GH43/DUF377 family glycosyl hydrolase